MSNYDREQWHLDKRVPIALILTIFLQSMAAIWWASSVNERIDQVERRLQGFAERGQRADQTIANQQRDIAVLVEQLKSSNNRMDSLSLQIRETNQLIRQLLEDPRTR